MEVVGRRLSTEEISHLFLSVRLFTRRSFRTKTSAGYYDYIVVDEYRAAAPTYQNLLTHYRPKILLGLTATPERMDDAVSFRHFDQRIAAEIRLPE